MQLKHGLHNGGRYTKTPWLQTLNRIWHLGQARELLPREYILLLTGK